MAKLYFRYGAMNSGKSTGLLQAAYNYEERGHRVLLAKPAVDTKGDREIVSRLGVTRTVDIVFSPDADVRQAVSAAGAVDPESDRLDGMVRPVSCVLVDEAQFLTPSQVDELFRLAVQDGVPVIAYGLRSDFRTRGFPGSLRLMELAHSIEELKTICRCGRKATLNARTVDGVFTQVGDQVAIDGVTGGEVGYESMCGTCYIGEFGWDPA